MFSVGEVLQEMSKSPLIKWLPFVLLFWLLGYLAAFFYSLATFSGEELLLISPLSWSLFEGFSLWMSWLPSLTSAALVLSFSLFFRIDSLSLQGGKSFFGIVFPGIMAGGIALTLLFTLGSELLLPAVHQQLDTYRFSSESASEWLEQGELLEASEDYAAAAEAFHRALEYQPENEGLKSRIEDIELLIPSDELAEPWDEDRLQSEAVEALEKARAAENREDYFTAHYWALLAGQWDPEQKENAMEIASRSWEAIADLGVDSKEKEQIARYKKKLEGYQLLQKGEPIRAYNIFLELSREKGGVDPDIIEFLERSKEKLKEASYPVRQSIQAERLPGPRNILFRLPEDGPFVFAGKLVTFEGNSYLINFEMLHLDNSDTPLFHLKAPAALFRENGLLLRGVDRETGQVLEGLRFLQELEEGDKLQWEGANWSVDGDLGMIKLGVPRSILRSFSDGRRNLGMTDIIALYQGVERDQQFGYVSFPSRLELLFRGSMPFFFLNILVFSVGFGRMLRYRGNSIPIVGFILMPAVPFFLFWLLEIFLWLMRILIAYLIISVPYSLAMVAMIVVHGIVLFGVLFFGAWQRE